MKSRMNSKWTIFALLASLTLGSCNPKASSGHDLELLTGTPWKYVKAGFDSNDEGIFNALDPRISGAEQDNKVVFKADGTGALDSLPFTWSFLNNDSTIYFQDQYYKIRALTVNRFEIYADQKLGGIHTRYTIILQH